MEADVQKVCRSYYLRAGTGRKPQNKTGCRCGFRIARPYKNPRRPAFRGGGGYRMPAYSTDQVTYSGSATVSTVPSAYVT